MRWSGLGAKVTTTYRAIAIEVGTKDNLLRSNKELDQSMGAFGIAHTYEEYDGDHTNRVGERIELNVLPFFSKHLAFAKPPASRPTK